MISLVLPYWNREKATDRALALMADQYEDLDLEIVIVDDGSETPYYAPRDLPWPVIVKRLPLKSRPKNPNLPFNVGVYNASGKYIALSTPEALHEQPVLPQMLESLQAGNDYVMAACWAPESGRWHAHSSVAGRTWHGITTPPNACFNFLALMHRELWDATGGFDPDYREGHCYEDTDFIKRLERVGANFVMRDDLVIQHPRQGTRCTWDSSLVMRNRALFMRKWRMQ